jgi:hypothetical protein
MRTILKEAVILLLATLMVTSTLSVANTLNTTTPAPDVESKDIWVGYTSEPQSTANVTWLHYDDGALETRVGSNYPPVFMAIRLTNAELAPYNGGHFVKTSWYHVVSNVSIPDHNYDAKIWIGNETRPITLLLNDTGLLASGEGWTNHNLSSPVTIDASNDYWIVIKCYSHPAVAYYDYPMPFDTNAASNISHKSKWWHNSNNHPETDFYEVGGSSPLYGAWLLRVAVESAPPAQIAITIKGGFGVSAAIKNVGTTPITNLSCTIALDGKLIFFGKTKTEPIPSLGPGELVTVKDMVFGFGKTGIAVNAGTASANATGTVILIFVIGVK